jgi:phage shock protein A
MNLLTRITATLTGKVEGMVSQIENHDAVVEAALKDTRAAVAKAKVRLDRVCKDGDILRKRLEVYKQMQAVWAERALGSATQDQAKALECIARRNLSGEQVLQIQTLLQRHDEIERKLQENVRGMEQRLQTLTQQQNLMRSRQSTAEAMRVISRIENNSGNGIEDTFDRWEMRITETEYASGSSAEIDSLDAAFMQAENTEKLKADLAALLGQKE